MPPAQNPTYFDPNGDLRLKVGPDNVTCVVCSRSLSRVSPVFKAMLYGSFAESKPTHGEWIVALPEDNQEAMFLLLNIVHGRFNAIPWNLTIERLYYVTVLTDKYDMTKSLCPWASRWLEHLPRSTDYVTSKVQRLWIARELGDIELFKDEALSLLHRCNLEFTRSDSEDGRPYDSEDEEPCHAYRVLESLEMIEALRIGRKQKIAALFGTVKQLLESLMDSSKKTCVFNQEYSVADEPSVCKAVTLASLLRALIAANLYPLPTPDQYKESVWTLFIRLNTAAYSIKTMKSEPELPGRQFRAHWSCNPNVKLIRDVSNVLKSFPDLVEQRHISYMDSQAAKLRTNRVEIIS